LAADGTWTLRYPQAGEEEQDFHAWLMKQALKKTKRSGRL
jgi:hypothetical protein